MEELPSAAVIVMAGGIPLTRHAGRHTMIAGAAPPILRGVVTVPASKCAVIPAPVVAISGPARIVVRLSRSPICGTNCHQQYQQCAKNEFQLHTNEF